MSVFSDRLRRLRKARDVTQAQLAAAIGITDRACRRYEAGENEPTLSVIQGIADFFEVSVDFLMGRDNYWQDKDGHIHAQIPPEIFTQEDIRRMTKGR
ncbi:MAG: helix-turn-helix transcriptional regulator [Firmicutes bacterium]|nr:helix-turn-helix transcriptional regulator [Bacillota bacterium]